MKYFSIVFAIISSSLAFAKINIDFPFDEFKDRGPIVKTLEDLIQNPGDEMEKEVDEKTKEVIFTSYKKYLGDMVAVAFLAKYNYPINKVISAYFANVPQKSEWTDYVKTVTAFDISAKAKLKEGVSSWTDHQHIVGIPPVIVVSARSFITDNKTVVNTKEHWVALMGSSPEHPEKLHFPNIPDLEAFNKENDQVVGEFRFITALVKSSDDGKGSIVFLSILADPKGNMPKWVVNFGAKLWPRTTTKNLKKFIETGHYRIFDFFAPTFDPKVIAESGEKPESQP